MGYDTTTTIGVRVTKLHNTRTSKRVHALSWYGSPWPLTREYSGRASALCCLQMFLPPQLTQSESPPVPVRQTQSWLPTLAPSAQALVAPLMQRLASAPQRLQLAGRRRPCLFRCSGEAALVLLWQPRCRRSMVLQPWAG